MSKSIVLPHYDEKAKHFTIKYKKLKFLVQNEFPNCTWIYNNIRQYHNAEYISDKYQLNIVTSQFSFNINPQQLIIKFDNNSHTFLLCNDIVISFNNYTLYIKNKRVKLIRHTTKLIYYDGNINESNIFRHHFSIFKFVTMNFARQHIMFKTHYEHYSIGNRCVKDCENKNFLSLKCMGYKGTVITSRKLSNNKTCVRAKWKVYKNKQKSYIATLKKRNNQVISKIYTTMNKKITPITRKEITCLDKETEVDSYSRVLTTLYESYI